MRTTLNLDDDLARAAKQKAAADGRTLTSLIEDALRAALSEQHVPQDRVTLPTFHLEARAGVDVDDPQVLKDLMYEEEDEHYRRVAREQGRRG